jgi:hypothetical protein
MAGDNNFTVSAASRTGMKKMFRPTRTARTAMSEQDQQTIQEWFKAAKVIPGNEATVVQLIDFIDRVLDGVISFHTLNAAAGSSELQGKLSWVRIPTPENYQEIAQRWLARLPEGLKFGDGLGKDMAGRVNAVIESQFGNHFSETNLDQALAIVREQMFGPPQIVKSQDQLEREHEEKLLKRDALRRKEELLKSTAIAHGQAEPEKREPTRGEAQQNVAKMLGGLIQGGHRLFAEGQNDLLRGMLTDGKSVQECWTTLEANTTDYLATIEIKKTIENAPGRNTGERRTNSEYLGRSADGLQREGMPLKDIAYHLLKESEAIRLKQNQ